MIKCIATDMDGTLLNSLQEISAENKQAILRAQAQGIEVVVATGRSYKQACYALEQAGLICPVICVNGAEVRSNDGGVISSVTIDKETARRIVDKLDESDVYYEIYTSKGTFTVDVQKAMATITDIILSANPQADLEQVREAAEKWVSEGRVKPVESYQVLFEEEDCKILKFLAFSFAGNSLTTARARLEGLPDLEISSSGHENLEITHKDAQKGIALEAFVKAKGIELSETMAIGDNLNDVSMLTRVGRSVAMGNAGEYIKSICDVVTATNEESGVGKAILEIL
jgi:Cof subfamily protein (haloacid dehalogenase superfamily)